MIFILLTIQSQQKEYWSTAGGTQPWAVTVQTSYALYLTFQLWAWISCCLITHAALHYHPHALQQTGHFQSNLSSMKVLLPPSTFPIPPNSNAKLSVTISNNVITTAYSVPTTTTTTTASSGKDSPLGGTSSTASSQDKSVNGGHINMSEVPSRRCRRQNLQGVEVTQCAIHRLHGGFDCMLAIFHYLGVKDLLRLVFCSATFSENERILILKGGRSNLLGMFINCWLDARLFLLSVCQMKIVIQTTFTFVLFCFRCFLQFSYSLTKLASMWLHYIPSEQILYKLWYCMKIVILAWLKLFWCNTKVR